jgi:hypothetical protein
VDPLTTGGEEEYMVSAAEVEAKVRWVMASEDEGAQALWERAAAARGGEEGGSSHRFFAEIIREWENLADYQSLIWF